MAVFLRVKGESEAKAPSLTVATLSKFAIGDEFFKPVFPRKAIVRAVTREMVVGDHYFSDEVVLQ